MIDAANAKASTGRSYYQYNGLTRSGANVGSKAGSSIDAETTPPARP